MFVDFFIRRPIFAGGLLGHHPPAGGHRHPHAAHRAVPAAGAAAGHGDAPSTPAPAPRWWRPRSPSRWSSRSTAWRGCGTSLDQQQRRHQRPSPSPSRSTREPRRRPRWTCRTGSSRARPQLPNEVKQTGVADQQGLEQHRARRGAVHRARPYDSDLFLSNYADVYMRDALKRVNGVGDVRIFGERKLLHADVAGPDGARAGSQLTADDVVRALQEQNVQVGRGPSVGQPPVRGADVPVQHPRAGAGSASPSEFDDIVVKTGQDGTLVRAPATWAGPSWARRTTASLLRFNGRSAVGLGVFQLPSANALDGARRRSPPSSSG